MITLLTEISQLDVAIDISLLSKHGAMLYGQKSATARNSQHQSDVWLALLNQLNKPQTAQFIFSDGIYFVCLTQIGYLIVAVREENGLDEVKRKCIALQARLKDSAIRKKKLLELLGEVDDPLKPVILDELTPLADKEVARFVLPMLAEYTQYEKEIQTRLLLAILQILGDCSIHEAIKPLKRFLQRYTSQKDSADSQVVNATKVSIMQLELSSLDENAKEQAQEFDGNDTVELINDDATSSPEIIVEDVVEAKTQTDNNFPKQAAKTGSGDQKKARGKVKEGNNGESHIRNLLANGRKAEAVAIIMKYIEAAAQQKMFDKAEKLREKIIEIDSMMLTEIIRAAEIIEEKKIAAILPEHLVTWGSLTQNLSEDEFSALYHSMSLEHYKNGETLVRQGDFLPKLFFINNGELQINADIGNQLVPLTHYEAGQILEGGSFFEASVWTINVLSKGAEVFILQRTQLEKLNENYPAIETKLIDFCSQFISPSNILKKLKKNRRRDERKPLAGRVAVTLIDRSGKDRAVSFKGDLIDISRGGMAFSIRSSRRKNANMLLGNKVRLTLPSGAGIKSSVKELTGVIVAVRGHHVASNEYSIHIDFDGELSSKEVQQLIKVEIN